MAKRKLTKSYIDKLAPSGIDQVTWDEELPGFGIRIKPSGVKSYIVQYRDRLTGESRRKTLGRHGPLMSFHEARQQAKILLAGAMQGKDPIGEGSSRRAGMTLCEFTDEYLANHALPKKRPKSIANDRSMLQNIILPALGHKKLEFINSRDVHALHVSMSETPYQANRTLSLLSKMFSLAVQWELRTDNPVIGVERYQEHRRERWLSDAELSRLLAAIAEHPNQRAANAIRLQLLTGARIGEVLAAR